MPSMKVVGAYSPEAGFAVLGLWLPRQGGWQRCEVQAVFPPHPSSWEMKRTWSSLADRLAHWMVGQNMISAAEFGRLVREARLGHGPTYHAKPGAVSLRRRPASST